MGAPVFLFRSRPVPIISLGNHCQGGMSFRESFVELEGSLRGGTGFRYELGRR
jgi:hypothetical protein